MRKTTDTSEKLAISRKHECGSAYLEAILVVSVLTGTWFGYQHIFRMTAQQQLSQVRARECVWDQVISGCVQPSVHCGSELAYSREPFGWLSVGRSRLLKNLQELPWIGNDIGRVLGRSLRYQIPNPSVRTSRRSRYWPGNVACNPVEVDEGALNQELRDATTRWQP